jgi:hypothetical protein
LEHGDRLSNLVLAGQDGDGATGDEISDQGRRLVDGCIEEVGCRKRAATQFM